MLQLKLYRNEALNILFARVVLCDITSTGDDVEPNVMEYTTDIYIAEIHLGESSMKTELAFYPLQCRFNLQILKWYEQDYTIWEMIPMAQEWGFKENEERT
jgi:hypothetical protein